MATKFRMYYIKQIVPDPPAPTIPVVLMPDGKYWTSVDLNIDDGQGEIFRYDNVTCRGYNFGTQYYYSHRAAKRVAASISGYHLPTQYEWQDLAAYISSVPVVVSSKLRSTYGWYQNNGTDDYGFTVLPVGNENQIYTGSQRDIEMLGSRTSYWCYDDKGDYERHDCVSLYTGDWSGIEFRDELSLPSHPFCFKVRLIKDS